ncbi:hypothetical protein, partial [Azospirillum sp. B4]|uniref:hypothetical protein n=1 Tax=Azospirillum sp. B4 TaxID=95605 RepID=UPI00131EEF7C
DLLGRPGINAKRRQTNERYLAKGRLRLRFPTRTLAKRYQALVREYGPPEANTHRYRRPKKA